eukprot:scpid105401/ scgid24057/ 
MQTSMSWAWEATRIMCSYWSLRLGGGMHCSTPLWFVVALRETSIVQILVQAGAHVFSSTVIAFQSKSMMRSAWTLSLGDKTMLEVIHDNGNNPMPILEAIFAVLFSPKSNDGDLHFCW